MAYFWCRFQVWHDRRRACIGHGLGMVCRQPVRLLAFFYFGCHDGVAWTGLQRIWEWNQNDEVLANLGMCGCRSVHGMHGWFWRGVGVL